MKRTLCLLPILILSGTLWAQRTPAPEDEDFFFIAPGFQHAGEARTVSGEEAGSVRIRVQDLATGQPTPCRIAVVGPDGHFYQPPKNRLTPYGMVGQWPNPGDWGNRKEKAPWRYLGRYFYSTGEIEVRVPPGDVRIEVAKGWEYALVTTNVTVTAGQSAAVNLEIQRTADMSQQGYANGDIHLHFPRASRQDDQIIFDLLDAEDIQYGFPLAYNEPAGPYDGVMSDMDSPQYRALGLPSQKSRRLISILSGQEYRSIHYGHIMYYLQDRLVHAGGKFNIDDGLPFGPTSADVMTDGGLAVMAHGGYQKEIYADAALGTLSGVELLQFGIYREIGLTDWYHILNTGYRFPAFGASDFPACRFLGDCRTYAWSDEIAPVSRDAQSSKRSVPSASQLTPEQWLRAAAKGQSFITTGPLLLLDVEGHRPGETIIRLPDADLQATLRVRCEVTPVTNVAWIVNGKVVADEPLKHKPQHDGWYEAQLTIHAPITESLWIAARAYSTTPTGLPDAEAHTNPVYVIRDNKRPYVESSVDAWLAKINGQIELHTKRKLPEQAAVLAYFQKAKDVLQKIRAQQGFAADVEPQSLISEVTNEKSNDVGRLDISEAELKDYLKPVPPRPAEEAVKQFEVVNGFEMQLVAAEPLVVDPVAAAFDEDGRLYVCEMRDYPYKPAEGQDPLGTVRLLRDTDGDGRFDQSTVFADKLLWAAGVTPWRGGVFVAASPDIWYLKDTDGDFIADVREKVFTGFGTGNQQGMVNNLQLGLDGWIYGSTGPNGGMISRPDDPDFKPVPIQGRDFKFQPDTREFAAITGTVQFGNTFDDWGNRFTCSESQPLEHIVLPDHYLARNPFLTPPPGIHNIAPGPVPIFRISPIERWREIRSLRRISKNERPATAPGVSHHVIDAAAGVTIYRGGTYPKEWHGQAFVGDGQNNLIHRRKLIPKGLTFDSERVDQNAEVVRSPDIWFRPVNAVNAPDGTLYFLDMSREVLESIHIPLDIAKHLDLKSGRENGRIYRLAPQGFQTPKPPRLSTATTEQLVAALDSPHGWYRDTAQRLLRERADPAAISLLRNLLTQSHSPAAQLTALHTLASSQSLSSPLIQTILTSTHPPVREHAIKLAEPLLGDDPQLLAAVAQCADDEFPRIRFQTAFSLGEAKGPIAAQALARLARRSDNDAWMRAAILSSVMNVAGEMFRELLIDAEVRQATQKFVTTPHGQVFLKQLAQLIGVRQQPDELQAAFNLLSQTANVHDPQAVQALTLELCKGISRRGEFRADVAVLKSPAKEWFAQRIESARKQAVDGNVETAERVAAIELLAGTPLSTHQSLCLDLLAADSPDPVQIASLKALSSATSPEITARILDRWSTFTPEPKRVALELMLSREDRIRAWLSAAMEGVVSAAEADSLQRDRLLGHANSQVSALAKRAFQGLTSASREAVIAEYQAALELSGRIAEGAKVFEKNCTACHLVAGKGVNIGPNLASNAAQNASALLTNILDPNRFVLPNYVQYIAVGTNGVIHTGLLDSQSANSVTLKKEKGETVTLLRSELDELTSSRKSLMPEGLEKTIPLQSMADLIAYLQEMTKKSPGDPNSERDRGTIAGTLIEEK